MSPKIKALLATGRTSNLPTVWSNILIAHLIVFSAPNVLTDNTQDYSLALLEILSISAILSSVAASLIYLGGCFLGDAIDAKFDATHKPERPIPSGILKRSTIFIASIILLLSGSVIAFGVNGMFPTNLQLITVLALLASVIAYSFLHKKSLYFGLPLIGACRFFLVLFGGAFAMAFLGKDLPQTIPELPTSIYLVATAIGLYTISFASVARTESSPKPFAKRKLLITLMKLLPLVAFIIFLQQPDTTNPPYLTLIPIIIYILWLTLASKFLEQNKKGQFVSMSLAGFCLLDTTIAALFGWPYLLITLALFTLALLLQKIVPAT